MTARRAAPLAAVAALVLAACGTPSADLFVVDRTGSLPDATLTLRVGDGGTVRCDGGEEVEIPSEDLLDARRLAEDLKPLLDRGPRLPPRAGSLLQYRVTGEEGEATFADNSRGLPEPFARLIRFTRKLATERCGLDR
ncbi:MAG TPA: hypothetical protein VHF89_07465 [Solirubrobacteraceae bacterium]|nr:hypothetical protein [Solirubrobacteraceae bacterium]